MCPHETTRDTVVLHLMYMTLYYLIVQSVKGDFHENRSNCDKSVKFGTELHYLIINQNRPGHK